MVTPQRRAVILTALPIERTAVLEHLRDHREELHPRGTVYRRGVFDERSAPWEILVAEIGAGNEGAAAEVERALDHFGAQVAVFVGVAGGIKDLMHGDVVASTKVYNYESGKEQTKLFLTRPEVESPSYVLLQRARAEAGSADWRQRIRPVGQPPLAAAPEAKVWPIAAGPKVLASTRGETFKSVRQHYGDAIAVEMEGHGFLLGVRMNHPVHGIVIRGISDLVGDKSAAGDLYLQPVAARNAAAFAFQLLAKLADGLLGQPALSADLGEVWQGQHLEDARRTAGPRYSPQLSVGTPLHDVFEALCGTTAWFASLQPQSQKLCKEIKDWSRAVENRDSHAWGAPFPDHLRQDGQAVADTLHKMGRSFVDLTERKEGASAGAIGATAGAILPRLRELYHSLRQDLESRHGKGTADSAHFRQFEASYQCAFPAANVDAAKELVALLENLETWGRSGVGRAAGATGILLAGVAGAGKTHALCDVAHHRASRGLRTAVLFGEHFKAADEPWDRIRQLLGFGPISRDDLLTALDSAGRKSGGPFLLCIDGLNESRPRGYWRDWLSALVGQTARYPDVRLCVSCRSTYEQLIVLEGHGLERVEYRGFAGMESTACREFFEYHGLEPPVAPSFHPEFANPLFLRLACQTLKAAGHHRMPTGWHGISTALKAFIGEKDKAFAQEYERDVRERVPRRALDEFMGEVERAKKAYLNWSVANAAVDRARPPGLAGPSILDWLVREGLLITDADPDGNGPDAEDVVRVAFERLGEHLFADRLLRNIQPDALTPAIESGALSFALSDGAAILANRGLVEALSIQIPEREEFSLELIDALPDDAPRDRVLSATIAALPWRDPQHMTMRTCEVALEALTARGMCGETFSNLLAIACQETSPDAFWLDGILRRQSMPQRDSFLCGYLHQSIGVSSAVDRLLLAPFEVDAAQVPEPVLVRWATILLWFCAAADRRVRDRATKGLVAITQPRPAVWADLVSRFANVNDEYVVERCLCAAYGTLLRARDAEAERVVAATVYETVFADTLAFQNALIRDHARCILELAEHDGVLPSGVDLKSVRTQLQSEWPLSIPSEDDVERYDKSRRDYPRLHTSCLHDDFYTYLLSRLEPFEHTIPRDAMGRWVLRHIIEEMGYGGKALASYDGYMVYHHGGGRGRPGWAERIGKKYQWIALARLAARLVDHVKPKRRSWEPKPIGVPLTYEQGRDIDPSLLAGNCSPAQDGPSWWMPEGYDFAALSALSNAAWARRTDDIPQTLRLLNAITGPDSRQWLLLEGFPEWSARPCDENDDSPYRQIWMHIRGYLVAAGAARKAMRWLAKQDFSNRWMPEGAEFHNGFIGEYPWAVPFTLYPDKYLSRGGGGTKLPARLRPVCNSISSSFDEDATREKGITICVPARLFFEDERLRWDGLNGYGVPGEQLRFLDPSITERGRPALLVDRVYILDYLLRTGQCLIWTVLGEKLIIRQKATEFARLTFNQAHLMDHEGMLSSSTLAGKND